ncbi:MAG TPA: ATP-binding protein [Granulicella sp.]
MKRLLHPRSLRMRLTLWYMGVLTAILAVYIVSVYLFQSWQLERQIYHDEVQDMETVEGLLYFDRDGSMRLHDEYHAHTQSRLLVDRLMEVQDLAGNILYRNERLGDLSLGGIAQPGEGISSFGERIIRMPGGDRVFLISHVHPVEGKPVLIRIAYSLAPAASRMHGFLIILLLAVPLTITLAGFAGYRITLRALRPLTEMAQHAERITASRLHERVTVDNPDDELGHMGAVLNHLFERLEESFAQLQRFTLNAAHELRTPLAATRSVGEVGLQQGRTPEEYRDVIASMLEETSRLTQTVDGLLLMARAESGQLTLHPEPIDLAALVSEVYELLEIVAEEKKVALQKEDPPATIMIEADRALLRLALINVIHNAIKYSPSNTTVRSIVSLHHDEHCNIARLTIEDQGPGIHPDQQGKVFERFYRSSQTELTTEGVGLGLAIARGAVEANHGHIYFQRGTHPGAICVLELPYSGESTL